MTDIVVIGAGMGGLTAALELAHRGLAVTLCEAAPAPGGKMRTLSPAGRPIDAGPTVLTMRWVFEGLFDAVGADLGASLPLTRADVIARHGWPDGGRLDLFDDMAASVAAVADFAGGREAARFRAMSDRAGRLFAALGPVFIAAQKPGLLDTVRGVGLDLRLMTAMAPLSTFWTTLGRELRDPRLRQLFARYATYVGGSPYATPALLLLIWHVEREGVWFLPGGLHRLARTLSAMAEERGATLRYGAPVAEILVEGGRAAGVRLRSGEDIRAGAVLYAGDVAALGAGLLGGDAARAVRPVKPGARSLSAFTQVMEAEAAGFPLAHHSVFFCEDYRAEFRDIFRERRLPRTPTVYVCAQDRENGPGPAGPERLLLTINAPPDGDIRPFDEKEIDACRKSALSLLGRCGLTLSPTAQIDTSPEGFATLFPGTGGALYGRSPHGMAASFLRPGARSRIPALYLAGGSVHPGAGVPMATLSGRLAAAAILSDRASTRPSRRAAISGGMSTGSRPMAPTR